EVDESPSDESDIERASLVRLKFIKAVRRAFPKIKARFQIFSKRIEIYEAKGRLLDIDDDRSTLIMEGQLKAGLRLPFSKFVCDVLNHYQKAPINMSSGFWHALRIIEDLETKLNYDIDVGDIVSFFELKASRTDDETYSLCKRSKWKNYYIYHTGVSNDRWKDSKVFRVRGNILAKGAHLIHYKKPNIYDISL
ncbi:hypothetical protein FRX31_006646, partial [Thalictrum thalictroides]